jgi:cell division protein ZapD
MIENTILYEQPLNELIRVCLRLEQLFTEVDHQIKDTSPLGSRHVVTSIIHLLQLLDRPDLKAKLAKELNYHVMNLSRLQNTPNVDTQKLDKLLVELDHLTKSFIDTNGKIAQPLREIELLNNLRLHLSTPGGGCSFDIPVFHYWLRQPAQKRETLLKGWLAEFQSIRNAIELILKLTREGAKAQNRRAEKGFYQELLDPLMNVKLIRVAVPNETLVHPETSVSRHFLSIRFFTPTIHDRPSQCPEDFSFWLSYCSL